MSDTDPADLNDEDQARWLSQQISQLLEPILRQIYPDDLPTAWVLISETFDTKIGRRAMVTAASPDIAQHQSIGLLQAGLMREQAQIIQDMQ